MCKKRTIRASTEGIIVIPAKSILHPIVPQVLGLGFFNGMPLGFDWECPTELEGRIDTLKFIQTIGEINDIIATCWPCRFAFMIGYGLAIFTFGLSLLIPMLHSHSGAD